jgi:hypothetical protein
MDAKLTFNIENMPEVIFAMRREMANMLREAAIGEPIAVRRKLFAVAADFEAGVK